MKKKTPPLKGKTKLQIKIFSTMTVISLVVVVLCIIYYNNVLNGRLVMINSFQKMLTSLSPIVRPLKTNFSFDNNVNIIGSLKFLSYDKTLNPKEISNLANELKLEYSLRKQSHPSVAYTRVNGYYQDNPLFRVRLVNKDNINYLHLGDVYSKYINLGGTSLTNFGNNIDDYQYLLKELLTEINANINDNDFQRNIIIEGTPGIEVKVTLTQERILTIVNNTIKKLYSDEKTHEILTNMFPNYEGNTINSNMLPFKSITIYTKQKVIENHLQAITLSLKDLNDEDIILSYENNKGQSYFIINYHQIRYQTNGDNFRFEDSNKNTLSGNKIGDEYNYILNHEPYELRLKIKNEIKDEILNYNYILTINDETSTYNLELTGKADHVEPIFDYDVGRAINLNDIDESDKRLIEQRITEIIDNNFSNLIPTLER